MKYYIMRNQPQVTYLQKTYVRTTRKMLANDEFIGRGQIVDFRLITTERSEGVLFDYD